MISTQDYSSQKIYFSSGEDSIIVSLKIYVDVKDAKFMMKKVAFNSSKPLNGLITAQENSAISFEKDIEVGEITLEQGMSQNLDQIGSIGTPALKSATFLTMIVSLSASIALIKIFQMMDYMVLFSVVHPDNFQKFVDVFSSNFINDIPNLFKFFVDDDCGEMKPKFVENQMSCQFISNCGNIISLFILLLFLKFAAWMLKTAFNKKNQLKSDLALKFFKFNSFFNMELFISLMDMF